MPLSAADIGALSRLLDQALEVPPERLEAWLATIPAEQQHLLPHLRGMLQAQAARTGASVPSRLPRVPGFDAADDPSDTADALPGERVGPYRLQRAIGRGGMGTVWLAERVDGIFEREVALKLPRLTRTPELARRMARERQIGALLEHPHIARLYDAGVDDTGRPYLVMERVQGVNLREYCRLQSLGVAACLGLMLQVCAAVAHAHRHLVVHRDLKPSNLLVDADGQVKLLDFGIAKLLDAGSQDPGSASDGVQRAHTPGYAAPEQLKGQPVATSADIYSLGVILFELLTGVLPGQAADADADPWAALDPDLRAVLRRAMNSDPGDRYSSVERFADDLRRVLEQRPVSAAPAGVLRRARLFGRRHRLALGTTAAMLGVLIAAAVLFERQHLREQAVAQRAVQAREFLFDLLEDTEPMQGQTAAQITGAQMVHSALERARYSFAEQPALRGHVYTQLGIMLRRQDEHEDALRVLREGETLLEGNAAADDPVLQTARAQLALELLEDDTPQGATEAIALAERALEGCVASTQACAKARAYARTALAGAVGRGVSTETALEHARLAVQEHDAAFGPGDAESAMARLSLAIMLRNAGRFAEADEIVARAMSIAALTRMRAADLLQLRINGALIQADLGRHEAAVQTLEEVLREEGSQSQRPLAQRLLAQSWLAQGRLNAAMVAADAAFTEARQTSNDWEATFAQQVRARILSALGRHDDAQVAIRDVASRIDGLGLAPGGLERLRAQRIAGELALRAGRLDDAQRELTPLPSAYRAATAQPLAPVDLAQALDLLGLLARRRGDLDGAAAREREAAQLLAAALPESHPLRRRNAMDAALTAALRPGGSRPALADAAQRYLDVLPADSAWRPMIQALVADPAAGIQWVL